MPAVRHLFPTAPHLCPPTARHLCPAAHDLCPGALHGLACCAGVCLQSGRASRAPPADKHPQRHTPAPGMDSSLGPAVDLGIACLAMQCHWAANLTRRISKAK
eukprot:356130-Chlamydomonas_euryale.AAC.5